MKLKGIKTLIFDLDGTLLDTLEDLAASVNHALEAHHYPTRTVPEVRERIGNGVRNLVMRCLPEGADEQTIDAVLRCFRAHYARHMDVLTRPYDDILPLLQELKRRGISMASNSNKYDKALQHLNSLFFSEYIPVAVGEREGVAKKPAPDGVHIALKELCASSAGAAYVGDSEVDIQTAKNAGLPFVGCAWGFRGEDALREAGADIVLRSPLELLSLLDEG